MNADNIVLSSGSFYLRDLFNAYLLLLVFVFFSNEE
jgi:hypothetical protein